LSASRCDGGGGEPRRGAPPRACGHQAFALATSLRIEEIVTLSLPQVVWESRDVRLMQKGEGSTQDGGVHVCRPVGRATRPARSSAPARLVGTRWRRVSRPAPHRRQAHGQAVSEAQKMLGRGSVKTTRVPAQGHDVVPVACQHHARDTSQRGMVVWMGVQEGHRERAEPVGRGEMQGAAAGRLFGLVGVPGLVPVASARPPIGLTAISRDGARLGDIPQLEGHPLRCVRRHRFRVPIRPG
jgi:hypothetical protein